MVKRTISCPSCGENIVIKEKRESVIDFNIEMAKRMWAEWEKKPDSEKTKELEKMKKEKISEEKLEKIYRLQEEIIRLQIELGIEEEKEEHEAQQEIPPKNN